MLEKLFFAAVMTFNLYVIVACVTVIITGG